MGRISEAYGRNTHAKAGFEMRAWLANSSDEPIIGSCDQACILLTGWLALVVLKAETASAATDKIPRYSGICTPCLACYPKPPGLSHPQPLDSIYALFTHARIRRCTWRRTAAFSDCFFMVMKNAHTHTRFVYCHRSSATEP